MLPTVVLVVWVGSGCDGGVSSGVLGPGLGESCVEDACRNGLVCANEGTCVAEGEVGSTPEGDDCSASLECLFGLSCSSGNVCVSPGSAGTGGAGDACSGDEDCQAGHFCGDEGSCTDIGIPYWAGASCPADDAIGDFRVLFAVPDLPAVNEVDFYGLPYPNDTRLDSTGHVDLSGYPDAGVETALPGLLAAIEDGPAGFGTNPTVYFRFSRAQDIDSVSVSGEGATVFWASLDEDADDYGPLSALQYFTRNTRGKYICQNWLGVSVYDGRPLEEGHTYAVWVTKGVTDANGTAAVRDNGFKLAIGDERPTDLTLARAYDSYAPFRAYVTREGLDLADIAGAAVFTTGYPSRGTRYFREVTAGEEVTIAASELTLCDDDVLSPCDDGGARSCGAADPDFAEVHGRLTVPRYRTDGGSVLVNSASLRPEIQGTEEVCFAMTLPRATMPERGWPVAIYGTDVGGTFRDAASNGLGAALAGEGIATISVELPGHGERGAAYIDPTQLAAWLGNRLQASADPHALVRYLTETSVDAAESPTASAIAFDATQVWYVGQGEGGAIGIQFLAWTLGVRGGVLGNPGAYEIHAFADQDSPVDIEHGLQAALGDSALNRWHPALNLLQQYFEPVDPVNNAYAVVRDSSTTAKHLLVAHGVADGVVPAASLRSALRGLSIATAGAVLDDYGQSTTGLPVFENVSTSQGRRTAASVQSAEGHAALLSEAGLARAVAFLGSGLDGSPTITE